MTHCRFEIRDPNQKFIYVYDFHKNWTFMVELINVNKEEDRKAYLSFMHSKRRHWPQPVWYQRIN